MRKLDPAAPPLGILACAGPLPIEVAEASLRQGRKVHIVAIEGFADDAVTRFPHERVSLGQLGRMLASFEKAGVGEIVIAGAMQRPNLLGLRIDWGFVRNLPAVLALTRGGDDSVLRRVVRFFEGKGLRVVGAGEVAPDLLAPRCPLTRLRPTPDEARAIERGAAFIAEAGQFDIGQGVVARSDGIVVVEGVRGTDAMLGDLMPGGAAEGRGRGGVLVKLAKPGQEMRIDLPTVGPETVRRAEAAGLSGIAVGGGSTIVLERERVAAAADEAGLFVIGFEPPAMGMEAATSVSMPILHVVARRAPTPSQRRDIAIARQVLPVLARHGAGRAAVIDREHVLAVSGSLPLPAFLATSGRSATWGRRGLARRRGVLVIDVAATETVEGLLDAELFKAVIACALAGVVVLAPLPDGERRAEIVAWANEAGVVLMATEGAS